MASLATPLIRYSADVIQPYRRPELAVRDTIRLGVSSTFYKGQLLAQVSGTNEVQTLTTGGTGAGATFTLTYGGVTSAAITWSATTATLVANIQAALDAMSSIGPGNTLVANSNLSSGIGDVLITFQNQLGSTAVDTIGTPTPTASLTTAMAETTPGVAGSSGLFVAYASGGNDGTQLPKGILPMTVTTDASGFVTLGDGTLGNDNFAKSISFWMWTGGIFLCEEVLKAATATVKTPITGTEITALKAQVIEGTVSARGIMKF